MFKVRNGTGGSLALNLERGSIILQVGKSFDLDGICSRKWIKTDVMLNRLISERHLVVIHDSEVGVPGHPIKDVVGALKKRKKAPPPKPVIIDFSQVPEPEEELPLEEENTKIVDLSDVSEKSEDAEIVIEEAAKEEAEDSKEKLPPNVCPICKKVCKSERGKDIHMRKAHK